MLKAAYPASFEGEAVEDHVICLEVTLRVHNPYKSSFHLLHSLNNYLSCNYEPGTEIGSEDTGVYRQRAFPHEACILGEDRQLTIRVNYWLF